MQLFWFWYSCFGAEDVKQDLVYGYLVGQCCDTMIHPSSLFWFVKFLFLCIQLLCLYTYMYVYTYTHTPHAWLLFMETRTRITDSCKPRVGIMNQTRSSARAVSTFNCWTTCHLLCFCFILHLFNVCTYATICIWRSKDNFQELILSFYHVGPKDRIEFSVFDQILP